MVVRYVLEAVKIGGKKVTVGRDRHRGGRQQYLASTRGQGSLTQGGRNKWELHKPIPGSRRELVSTYETGELEP